MDALQAFRVAWAAESYPRPGDNIDALVEATDEAARRVVDDTAIDFATKLRVLRFALFGAGEQPATVQLFDRLAGLARQV